MSKIKIVIGLFVILSLLVSPIVYVTPTFKDGAHGDFARISHNGYSNGHIKLDSMVVEENPNTFLVKFRTASDLNKFAKSGRFEILAKYHLLPLALVKGNYRDVIRFSEKNNIRIEGVYYNYVFALPKYTISKSGEIDVTSLQSAKAMNADYLWGKNIKGQTVKISIIDSGVDPNHPELEGKVIEAQSFVLKKYGYEQDEPAPFDPEGIPHGTMVAGVAAGKGVNDPERGTGVAPEALLFNARVFPKSGGGATLAAIIAAIEWSVDKGADVINMSLGGGGLYSDPLKSAVEAAAKKGVVVVIAAGNEGDSGRFSMSVGSPGYAPSAITVGATNVDGNVLKDYSSIGPTIDLVVKPDVVAPSGVPTIYPGGAYVDSADGTSFSSPHVAGGAALLVQYLKSLGVPKSKMPGIVKTALIAGAKPVYTSSGLQYLDLAVGGGFVDLKQSYLILSGSQAGSEFKIFDVLPRRIPTGLHENELFFPYAEKVFLGQTIVFNMTIASGYTTTVNVNLEGDIAAILQLNSPTTLNLKPATNLYELNITVKETASTGEYSGYIVFSDGDNEVKVPIGFKVAAPKFKALWDLHYTDWTVDFPYGQYRFFYKSLEKRDVMVIQWFHTFRPFTYSDLEGFDFVFLPDTASISPILDENGFYIENTTLYLTPSIDALNTFISNGGSVILIAMDPLSSNITAVNEFTSHYGIKFKTKLLVPRGVQTVPKAETVPGHILTSNVSAIPFYGVGLEVDEGLATPLAYYSINPVMALYMNEKGGSLLALSTNFIFDNWAFLGQYAGISGDTIDRFVDNYLYMLSLNYLSSVSLSKESVTMGDTVDVTVQLESGAPSNLTGITRNYFGAFEFELQGSGASRTGTVEIKASGNNLIGVRFYTDRGWVDAGVHLFASKSEENPPAIEIPNLVYVQKGSAAIIELTISDDSPLPASTKLVTISYANISFSMSASQVSETKVKITLRVPWSVVNASLQISEKNYFVVLLKINYTDGNLNYEYTEASVTVKLGAPPTQIPVTLIIGVIVILVIVVGVFAFLRRRQV